MSTDRLRFDAPVDDVPRPVLQLFARYAGPHRVLLGCAVLASLAYPALALLPVYLLHVAIDGVLLGEATGGPSAWVTSRLGDGTGQRLLGLAAVMVALATAAAVLSVISSLAWGRFAQEVQHALRNDGFAAVQRRGVAFVERHQTGQLMSILNDDVSECNRLLERFLKDIVETAARFVGIGIILLALHWQLAILTAAVLPVMAAVARWFVSRIRPLYAELRQRVGVFNAGVENALSGMEVVTASGAGSYERERIRTRSRDVYDAQWRVVRAQAGFFPAISALNWWTFGALLAVGGYWYRSGPPLFFTRELSLGILVAFLIYNQQLATPLMQASHLVDVYYEARAAVARIFVLFEEEGSARGDRRPTPITNIGDIELEGVHFSYPGEPSPALTGVSLVVEQGTTIGVVGPTGSGKTTLLSLLLGFYDPDVGRIRVGDRDLRELDPESFRAQVGYVPQEPYLFTGTVRENVAYPGRDVPDEAIENALRMAQAWAFVSALPEGLETEIGQAGTMLSAGQRQRIAIARALLEDPPLLLLDEATNNLDLTTEAALQRSITRRDGERTTITVAHRLASVRHADLIVVLDEGQIVEQGNHADLVGRDGPYARLWEAAFAGEDVPASQPTT